MQHLRLISSNYILVFLFYLHSILYGPHENSVALGYECLLQDVSRPCVGLAYGPTHGLKTLCNKHPASKFDIREEQNSQLHMLTLTSYLN